MSLGSHERPIGKSQEYITPKHIIDAVGPFDLDPCAAVVQPWKTAEAMWPINGLNREWFGLVWMNPPFDRRTIDRWLQAMARHNNGIALLHARTETQPWFDWIWGHAKSILFLKGRIHFFDIRGNRHPHNSGAAPVLIAYGDMAHQRLSTCNLDGMLVVLK